jgi:hypothetical protein
MRVERIDERRVENIDERFDFTPFHELNIHPSDA